METLKKIYWPAMAIALLFGIACVLPVVCITINHGFEAVGVGPFVLACVGVSGTAVVAWASVLDE